MLLFISTHIIVGLSLRILIYFLTRLLRYNTRDFPLPSVASIRVCCWERGCLSRQITVEQYALLTFGLVVDLQEEVVGYERDDIFTWHRSYDRKSSESLEVVDSDL